MKQAVEMNLEIEESPANRKKKTVTATFKCILPGGREFFCRTSGEGTSRDTAYGNMIMKTRGDAFLRSVLKQAKVDLTPKKKDTAEK